MTGDCQVCAKPLLEGPGPVVMDREGRWYHFLCWRDQSAAKKVPLAKAPAEDRSADHL
jgi:hypothetical protein